MKIELDKYYTPDDLAKHCVDKTIEIIGSENISMVLKHIKNSIKNIY